MKKSIAFLYNKSTTVFFFICFCVLNLYYFSTNFLFYFFNKGSNADEYYENNIYSFSKITIDKIFSTPSQPYIFISSLLNDMIDSPKMATRAVSLFFCIFLVYYLIRKIIAFEFIYGKIDRLERIIKITLFLAAVFITNQMYMGTSDFLAIVFIIPAFLIITENLSNKINLKAKESVLIGTLFALSITTRPTVIVLLFSFYLSLVLVIGFNKIFCKENYIILATSLILILLINSCPIIQQNRIILDVKEIPKETGVNWFQRNYLMAKYWDSGKVPNTHWLGVQDVINFKKANPNFVFPKNQIDLLIKEPGLYSRQMLRMFFKALYSSYRYMYLLFPILFLSFLKKDKLAPYFINSKDTNYEHNHNKIIVLFHLLSIVFFSFLAVKLFEFRWVIPTLILYVFFALKYLSNIKLNYRYLIYNVSFISGIIMYVLFYLKTK